MFVNGEVCVVGWVIDFVFVVWLFMLDVYVIWLLVVFDFFDGDIVWGFIDLGIGMLV